MSYVWKDVRPRIHRIFFTAHPWLSAVLSLSAARGYFPFAADVKFFDVAGALLTYNTVVIGFCVSAMAICFTFSKRFSKLLCMVKDESTGFSSYRDLVFVFSWTSLAHTIASIVVLFLYFFVGNFVFEEMVRNGFSWVVFVFLSVELYCIFQFLVTVITVHQAANIYAMASEKDSI